MSASPWWSWLRDHAGGGTNREMAARASVDPSNLTRWSKGDVPDAGTAIRVARALGRSPVEALHVAGYLSKDEADLREIPAGLDRQDDADLLLELLRRHKNRLLHGRFEQLDKSSLALVTAWNAAEKLMQLPGDPLYVRGDAPEGVDSLAARRGHSEGEVLRRAQDDAAEAPDQPSAD